MVNQGLLGAIEQYWTVEEKPRLHRRNTFFEDITISNENALKLGIVAVTMVITIVIMSMVGVML